MQKVLIKNWRGQIIGSIETDEKSGDKIIRNFGGVILGYYRANLDMTTDFNGRFKYQGDQAAALIQQQSNS